MQCDDAEVTDYKYCSAIAMVARLTPVQKVACLSHVGVSAYALRLPLFLVTANSSF